MLEQDVIKQKVEEKLAGWAAWSARDSSDGLGYPRGVSYVPPTKREPGAITLLMPTDEDAMRTEQDINSLAAELRDVLVSYWLYPGTVGQKCKKLKYHPRTFYRHLNKAYGTLFNQWFNQGYG